jgi:glucose-1-phosphate adenylyltransferase
MRENRVMGLLLHGRENRKMGVLIDNRTIGSVPFGGRYRLIDFMLSNMVHAGINDVGVITRDKYTSLVDHLGSGRDWDLARKSGGLFLLPPAVSESGSAAYRGELESLYSHRGIIENTPAHYVVLSTTDLVGNIDLIAAIREHIATKADVTALVQPVSSAEQLGDAPVAMTVDESGRVIDVTVDAPFSGACLRYLGAFIMDKKKLLDVMNMLVSHSRYTITRDLLQGCHQTLNIRTFPITEFCVKIQTLKDYFETSMFLLDQTVRASLFPSTRPILTRVRDEVPVFYGLNANVKNSLVADGCVIEGTVENSILFRNVKVGPGALIKNCVLMQDTVISADARLDYVVADRRCFINEGRVLAGYLGYPVAIEKFSVV